MARQRRRVSGAHQRRCASPPARLEEHQIGWRVVEEAPTVRRSARNTSGCASCPSGVPTAASNPAKAPSAPACSIASTGMMQTKMPANRIADLADRLEVEAVGLAMLVPESAISDSERDHEQQAIAHQILQFAPACRRRRRRCRASSDAEPRMAAMMHAIGRKIDAAVHARAGGVRGARRSAARACPRVVNQRDIENDEHREHDERRRHSVWQPQVLRASRRSRRRAGSRRTAADRRAASARRRYCRPGR